MPLATNSALLTQLALDMAHAKDWAGSLPKLSDWSQNGVAALRAVGPDIAAAYGGAMPPAYQSTVDQLNAIADILAEPITKALGNFPRLWLLEGQAPALAAGAAIYQGVAQVDAWNTASGGGITQPVKNAAMDFVNASLRDGYWPKLSRMWLHASPTLTHALCDIKIQAMALANNSPVFTAGQQFLFDGVSSWVDTNYRPDGTGRYTLNDAGYGCYVRTQPTLQTGFDVAATHITRLQARAGGAASLYGVNGSASPAGSGANPGAWNGTYHVNRRNSPTNITGWRNGALHVSTTQTANALPAFSFGIGAGRVTGTGAAIGFTTSGISASWLGASLLDAEITALHTNLTAYLTTIGALP